MKETSSVATVPPTVETQIKEWREIASWLEKAKQTEMDLRQKIANYFFPKPSEGVNRVIFPGHEVVVDHKINRKLDEAQLDHVMAEMPEDFRTLGVLIEYKPKLCMKGFRILPEAALAIFSQALTETPGAPTLAINNITTAFDPVTAPAVVDSPAKRGPLVNKELAKEIKASKGSVAKKSKKSKK
jgi:hypothetical protein